MGGLDLPKADCAALVGVLSARGAWNRPHEVRGVKLCNLHLLASEGVGSPTCRPTVYEVRKETCNDWGNDNLGDQPFFGV